MKKKLIGMLTVCMVLMLSGPGGVFAKDIVVLSQFPLSGPHGSLAEVGW